MARSPLLYATRETFPVLDLGQPILIGPSATGSLLLTSSTETHFSIYPNIQLSFSALTTNTDSCYLIPLFPSGTIPKRFEFEMSFTAKDINCDLFWIIGTENSSSANFNGICFSLNSDQFATIANGVFSSSTNNFADSYWWITNELNYIKKEFELKTQTPTTGSDIVFRCREFTACTQENSTFQYDTIYKSHLNFPFQKFPSTWNNKTFNKLFLGLTANGPTTGQILIDLIRIRKHIMDWDS